MSDIALSPEERMRIAETWNFRYDAERTATLRFERLARELRENDAAPQVIELAHQAIEDEKRHAILCKEIALEFGFPYRADDIEVEALPLAPPSFEPRDAVLYEVVAFCCITETVNTTMLVDTLNFAKDERIREAVRTILRDEVNHSRLGWAHLTHETSLGRGTFFSGDLIGMFSQLGIDEILERTGTRETNALAHYGEINDERRISLFSTALYDIVLPGLESVGLDTEALRAWLKHQSIVPTAAS
jgi:hypothetical protein